MIYTGYFQHPEKIYKQFPKETKNFLFGNCMLFAKALQQIFSYRTVQISNDEEEGTNIIHVFCVANNKHNNFIYIDVRGITDNEDIFFAPFNEDLDEDSYIDDFNTALIDMNAPEHQITLQKAIQFSRSHPNYYKKY